MSERMIGAHLQAHLSGIKARTLFNKEHWEIYEGNSFTAFQVNEDMGDGDKINFGFKTPTTPEIHMIADFRAKTAAHMTIFEGPTFSGGLGSGLAVPIHNRDRNSATQSTLLTNINETGFSASGALNSDLTGLGGGTAVWQAFVFAVKNTPAGLSRGKQEFILKTGTIYAIEVEADAATSAAEIELNWYEE